MLCFRRVAALFLWMPFGGRPACAQARAVPWSPPSHELAKVVMRFWPGTASSIAVRSMPAAPRDLAHQIEEGYLVALSALRLSVKNGVILRILRDGAAWDETESAELARQAIDALAEELRETAVRLSDDSVRAAPSPRESRGARSKRDLARVRRKRDEADRLAARSRTLRGVVERLEVARDDAAVVRDLALRARDDTIGELMQARLIPRAEPVLLTEEEQREAIAGVKADLQRLIDERTGY